MYRKHTVKIDETFESIAIQYLYQSARASDIKILNNTNQIYEGQVLKIPDLFPAEKGNYEFEEAGIVINGKEIASVPGIAVDDSFDALGATFNFTLPTEDIFKEISVPFGYQDVDIYTKSDLLMSGKILRVATKNGSGNNTTYSGMQPAAILSQLNFPPSLYPREFSNASLKTIAEKICKPFGISVEIDDNAVDKANEKFLKSAAYSNEYLAGYLADLAHQRSLIIGSTPEGALRISLDAIEDADPVLNLVSPYGSTCNFDGSKIYSDYTAFRKGNSKVAPKKGNEKLDIDFFRTKVIQQTTRQTGTIKDFIKSEVIRSLLDAFEFSFSLPYIRTANGDLLKKNQIIQIEAPEHKINKPTNFIIRTTGYKLATNSDSIGLNVFPLDWYQGKFTKFWEE